MDSSREKKQQRLSNNGEDNLRGDCASENRELSRNAGRNGSMTCLASKNESTGALEPGVVLTNALPAQTLVSIANPNPNQHKHSSL